MEKHEMKLIIVVKNTNLTYLDLIRIRVGLKLD